MRVLYAFFCEDLRTEQSGQTTAVGLWGGQCSVGAFPATLRSMAFHAFVENRDQEVAPFTITVSVPGQPPAPPIADVLRPTGNAVGQNFNIFLGPVPLAEAGEIQVRFQIESQAPIDATYTLEVVLGGRPTDPPALGALQ